MMESREREQSREQSAGNDRWGRGEEPARGGGGGWRDGPRDRRDDRMDDRGPPRDREDRGPMRRDDRDRMDDRRMDDRGPPRDRMDDRGPPMRRDEREDSGPRGGDAWKPSSGGGKRFKAFLIESIDYLDNLLPDLIRLV